MPKTRPPALQVLFEPFPNPTADGYTWNRDGAEAFAGTYWIDALDADGGLKERGYRVMIEGCAGCRRSDDEPRAHWDIRNDSPGAFAPKRPRRCGKWKMVESVVKAFGGWKRVHYVELPENEGLEWQPIPQRRRIIEACPVCKGTGYGAYDTERMAMTDCPAGCGVYTDRGRGEVQVAYEGPVRPDRFGMTDEQRRIRRPEVV